VSTFYILSTLLAGVICASLGLQIPAVSADCDLPGTSHGDNSPSKKEGKKMIEKGASACQLAKKCDAMEIKIKVDSDELKDTHFYKMAHDDLKDELEEVAEEGHGADGIECYELEYAVEEA
jgi:hypothetical protein